MLNRRHVLTALAASPVILASTPLLAAEPPVYSAGGQIAINGYDPVGYFTQGASVKGDAAFTSEHDGAIWQFASGENKAMFDADPAKYAPQYGGYCAWAVSKGYTASTDPDAWTVVDDKLYLNFSKAVRARWSIGRAGNIDRADANWPSVLG